MATALSQRALRRAGEPESSKDLSSSLSDDHDGVWRTPSPVPSCNLSLVCYSWQHFGVRLVLSDLFLMRAVPQTPSASLPGKQGLSHGAKDSRTARLRFSLVAILSWKKHKVSPVLTSVISEEAGLVESLQRLDLSSQWSSLPDHLLESIFSLMKDGEKEDWTHVQVALLA